jgi:hypothetical protein
MAEQLFLPGLTDGTWVCVKDGNHTARSIFDRHYSRRFYADGRNPKLFVGPGNKMVLLTENCRALFVWWKFRSMDGQDGINCAVFRNENSGIVSSSLILEADRLADQKWGTQRHYTYVNPARLHTVKQRCREMCPWPPGRCFIEAGWRHCGWSKSGLMILEKPAVADDGCSSPVVPYRVAA